MQNCPICHNSFMNLMEHIRRSNDEDHYKLLSEITDIIKSLCRTELYLSEIQLELIDAGHDYVTKEYIKNVFDLLEPEREKRIISERGVEIDSLSNISKPNNVWSKPTYHIKHFSALEKCKEKFPYCIPSCNTQTTFEYYKHYMSLSEDVTHCHRCGCELNKDNEYDHIDFIDGYLNHILLSNMRILCKRCAEYAEFNDGEVFEPAFVFPYQSISKSVSFAASHKLPHHEGKCGNWHGHEWIMEITLRQRVDSSTMMVMDFKNLKKILNETIVDVLDHGCLNDYLLIPTAENLTIWCWEQLMFVGHLKGIEKIKLWESSDSYATLTLEDMISSL